ncbi:hypothetical protein IWQ61_003546 [Dispira simplex]|nr:hypothetical protein IWQ61_003546 [Dispira simplex]
MLSFIRDTVWSAFYKKPLVTVGPDAKPTDFLKPKEDSKSTPKDNLRRGLFRNTTIRHGLFTAHSKIPLLKNSTVPPVVDTTPSDQSVSSAALPTDTTPKRDPSSKNPVPRKVFPGKPPVHKSLTTPAQSNPLPPIERTTSPTDEQGTLQHDARNFGSKPVGINIPTPNQQVTARSSGQFSPRRRRQGRRSSIHGTSSVSAPLYDPDTSELTPTRTPPPTTQGEPQGKPKDSKPPSGIFYVRVAKLEYVGISRSPAFQCCMEVGNQTFCTDVANPSKMDRSYHVVKFSDVFVFDILHPFTFKLSVLPKPFVRAISSRVEHPNRRSIFGGNAKSPQSDRNIGIRSVSTMALPSPSVMNLPVTERPTVRPRFSTASHEPLRRVSQRLAAPTRWFQSLANRRSRSEGEVLSELYLDFPFRQQKKETRTYTMPLLSLSSSEVRKRSLEVTLEIGIVIEHDPFREDGRYAFPAKPWLVANGYTDSVRTTINKSRPSYANGPLPSHGGAGNRQRANSRAKGDTTAGAYPTNLGLGAESKGAHRFRRISSRGVERQMSRLTLAGSFTDGLLNPPVPVHHSGHLTILVRSRKGGAAWKRFWVVMDHQALTLYHPETREGRAPRGRIPLIHLIHVNAPKSESVKLENPSSTPGNPGIDPGPLGWVLGFSPLAMTDKQRRQSAFPHPVEIKAAQQILLCESQSPSASKPSETNKVASESSAPHPKTSNASQPNTPRSTPWCDRESGKQLPVTPTHLTTPTALRQNLANMDQEFPDASPMSFISDATVSNGYPAVDLNRWLDKIKLTEEDTTAFYSAWAVRVYTKADTAEDKTLWQAKLEQGIQAVKYAREWYQQHGRLLSNLYKLSTDIDLITEDDNDDEEEHSVIENEGEGINEVDAHLRKQRDSGVDEPGDDLNIPGRLRKESSRISNLGVGKGNIGTARRRKRHPRAVSYNSQRYFRRQSRMFAISPPGNTHRPFLTNKTSENFTSVPMNSSPLASTSSPSLRKDVLEFPSDINTPTRGPHGTASRVSAIQTTTSTNLSAPRPSLLGDEDLDGMASEPSDFSGPDEFALPSSYQTGSRYKNEIVKALDRIDAIVDQRHRQSTLPQVDPFDVGESSAGHMPPSILLTSGGGGRTVTSPSSGDRTRFGPKSVPSVTFTDKLSLTDEDTECGMEESGTVSGHNNGQSHPEATDISPQFNRNISSGSGESHTTAEVISEILPSRINSQVTYEHGEKSPELRLSLAEVASLHTETVTVVVSSPTHSPSLSSCRRIPLWSTGEQRIPSPRSTNSPSWLLHRKRSCLALYQAYHAFLRESGKVNRRFLFVWNTQDK